MKDSSNISQELLETIERYYNDTMSKEERSDFELKLKKDPVFKTQVEDIKTLILGIENQSLKEQLDVFHETMPKINSKDASTSHFFSLRKLAAAVVILLAVTGFWWFNTPQHEKLYAKFFTPDPGLPTVMSSNNADTYAFYNAMVDYKQGDYTTAISKWKILHDVKPENDTLNYFLGVAHMANDNEQIAISFLENASQNSDFVWLNEAYYYLGLANLKAGNLEDAKSYLQQSNSTNSKALLSKLND